MEAFRSNRATNVVLPQPVGPVTMHVKECFQRGSIWVNEWSSGGHVLLHFQRRMKGDTTCMVYGDLPDILGFGTGDGVVIRTSHRKTLTQGNSIVDLRRGFESLYVYSSIVEPRIVGDKIAPLLRIVPITGRHGEMVTARFDHVQYIPVLSREFGSIETEISRHVPFERGKVTVTLHFRRCSSGLFR